MRSRLEPSRKFEKDFRKLDPALKRVVSDSQPISLRNRIGMSKADLFCLEPSGNSEESTLGLFTDPDCSSQFLY